MNDTDLPVIASLMDSFEKFGWKGPVILDVSQMHLMKEHLILLKGLLEERSMRGLFLSVDRPHQYLEHIARMHKINIGGMTFVDIICKYSADTKQGSKVGLMAGPYNINNLQGAFRAWEHSVKDSLKDPKRGGGFVLIDNPSALLHYYSLSRVEFLLCHLHEAFDKDEKVLVPLLIDKERNRALYESVRPFCIGEISSASHDDCLARSSPIRFPDRNPI
jgi:hypothetical protein